MPQCPSRNELDDYLNCDASADDDASSDAASVLERHVSTCERCSQVLAELTQSVEIESLRPFIDLVERELDAQRRVVPTAETSETATTVALDQDVFEKLCDVPRLATVADVGPLMHDEFDFPSRIGSYLIAAVLERTASNTVYVGLDPKTRQDCLVQVFSKDRTDKNDITEARRLLEQVAAIDHPNVVRIHEVGEVDGQLMLVTEFLRSIDSNANAGSDVALPTSVACRYMRDAAAGLQAAHDRQVVHGNLRPSSFALNNRDEIKVRDFGRARLRTASVGQSQVADFRTDIRDLGEILVFYVTGHRLRSGDRWRDVLLNWRDSTRPDHLSESAGLESLIEVIEKMLTNNRKKSYRSMQEVIDALESFATLSSSTNDRVPSALRSVGDDAQAMAIDRTEKRPKSREENGARSAQFPPWLQAITIAALVVAAIVVAVFLLQ